MAKGSVSVAAVCRQLIDDARKGVFKPVYLLMGDEPYYPDLVCNAIVENCIDEYEKDFNETICYGSEVDADMVTSAARRYPMMADRQLVVVKEAQLMKDYDQLSYYCAAPLDTTVFVVVFHKASVDKRTSFYKNALKNGVVVESPAIRDYEISSWISEYFASKGVNIDPSAAVLMGESAGTDLSTIAAETDKLFKSLPEGVKNISVEDVERNVGVSRQFSIFELTKALSYRDAAKAVRVATYIGSSAKFSLAAATSALFLHFNRILRYGALLKVNRNPSAEEKAKALAKVQPFFYREYDEAVRKYPVQRCMQVISLLKEYDFKSKGGDAGEATDGMLLLELVTKILNS